MSSVAGSSRGNPSSHATALVGEIDKNIKYKTIEPFTGERNKLQGFLLQLRLYVKFNGERFRSETEQVLWAVTLLEGKAMHWIEGFLEDYLKHTNDKGVIKEDKMEDTTVKIFKTWNGFLEEIKVNFGVMDERKEAERAIESLRQKGSATSYTREFQRYSTRTEWGDEALRYQYRKGLKDSVKDELLRTGHSTNTLEELIAASCEIDNAWYERSMERKGKYDPDYKRMGEGRTKTFRSYNQRHGDPMELDATGRKELSPQERQKHMQERTCFNCGKTGHMARNCKANGGQRRNTGRRRELNATALTGKNEYSGLMQLNATMSGPLSATLKEELPSDDEFEQVTQSLEAVGFVENLGNDVNSESSDNESSVCSEMSREEFMTAQVLAGAETARTFHNTNWKDYENEITKTAGKYPNTQGDSKQLIAWKVEDLDDLGDYRLLTYHLIQAVKQQISETQDAETLGIRRSQQYQDKLASNIDFLPELEGKYRDIKLLTAKRENELKKLREEENVARIDHPRHAELAWSFCYTDSCTIHNSSKIGSGYWPKKIKPVYWERKPRYSANPTIVIRDESSKN
jgi:hypothetical protein